ncbi:MAG: ABC transporter ATP-binding protein [Thermodesulfobacteriaceae bacterium]|nr:ABC transporter ATP-binding protein [Thermodesulfobacteriaceae bacterium]MCX8041230.1 ABC transporter ATP-binding protein [Thermodesulfobacteriaceae bacterium]MDW8136475.1 ABC transporter ATP-binding protein [Thermodesulfobacterium sp.]
MKNFYMIEVKNLVKTYGGKRVVDGISFWVKKGEVFGLIGPNGAGKTTIIKILTTLVKPDEGEVFINGSNLFKEPQEIKKIIGVVPQENNLDRDLTVYENLLIYGMLHKVRDLKRKIEEVLNLVELWDRRNSLTSTLSGGMQRRLVIARAFLPDPPILFLDEPTVGLDPQIRKFIWELIRRSKAKGKTIILTTHYIEEAENLCERVGIIHKGKLMAIGTPLELKEGLGRFVVEHINGDGKLIQWIFKTEEEAYKLVQEKRIPVSIRRVNLEDVFINLTGKRIE